MKRAFTIFAVALSVCVGCVPATAGTVLFSDFDPTNVTYQGGSGIYGTSNTLFPGAFNSMAMAFTPAFQASLTSIDVAISWSSGTNSVVLTLNSDNSGVPGGVIASWTLNNLPSFGFCCAAEAVTAISPILLTAGTRYWVGLHVRGRCQFVRSVFGNEILEGN